MSINLILGMTAGLAVANFFIGHYVHCLSWSKSVGFGLTCAGIGLILMLIVRKI